MRPNGGGAPSTTLPQHGRHLATLVSFTQSRAKREFATSKLPVKMASLTEQKLAEMEAEMNRYLPFYYSPTYMQLADSVSYSVRDFDIDP